MLEDPNYVNIGMRDLIVKRHDHPVKIEGAGNLGEYVPFYFAGHTPMLLTIKNGTKGVVQLPQQDIVFIVCKLETICKLALPFIFTDRHAKAAFATFYQDINDLNKLDWDTIQLRYWASDDSKLDRQEVKQAEFLIHQYVPVECIHALVVKTSERKAFFEEMIRNLGLTIAVHVDENRKLYY
jgi:hypothetical protein